MQQVSRAARNTSAKMFQRDAFRLYAKGGGIGRSRLLELLLPCSREIEAIRIQKLKHETENASNEPGKRRRQIGRQEPTKDAKHETRGRSQERAASARMPELEKTAYRLSAEKLSGKT